MVHFNASKAYSAFFPMSVVVQRDKQRSLYVWSGGSHPDSSDESPPPDQTIALSFTQPGDLRRWKLCVGVRVLGCFVFVVCVICV